MFPALAQEAEFARIEAIFEQMDRDSDGYVSREPDTCLRLPAARECFWQNSAEAAKRDLRARSAPR